MMNDTHNYNTRSKSKMIKKPSLESSSESEESSDEEDSSFDVQEYRKLLANLFPSTYSINRAISHKRKKVNSTSPTSSQENVIVKSRKTFLYNTLIEDSEYDEESDSDYEEETEEEEEEAPLTSFTIHFTSSPVSNTGDKPEDNTHSETNTKKFEALIREKNNMSDTLYFKNKLTSNQQEHLLQDLERVVNMYSVDKPYRIQLLYSDIPLEHKAIAFKKINQLKFLEPGQGEFYKAKQWVSTFMNIPFGKYKQTTVNLKDNTREECVDFIHNAKDTLDKAVYGMNDVKMQIMQMVGMWITNPEAVGTAIAIKGPMGTGKTTLVKEGISKILGREFAFMALGGATDSSFLEGHSYTYEGATWGKIIDSLIQCKSMNPIFFFD